MLALRSGPGAPAQFVFERDRLHPPGAGGATRVLAFVTSVSRLPRDALLTQVVAQASAELGLDITPLELFTDRRATFVCDTQLQRPMAAIAPGLMACGDYVCGPYPATLEGAVRSGQDAAVAALALPG